MREEFFRTYDKWFPAQACDRHKEDFVRTRVSFKPWDPTPCADCLARIAFDRRSPGLFKKEYEGDSFVGLCSKTYFCEGENQVKLSSKGLNKSQNALTLQTYRDVLTSGESGEGVNRGFITVGKEVFTYEQKRKSLSYFYIKRIVGADGITTFPTNV